MRESVLLTAALLGLCTGFAVAGENRIIGWRTNGTGLFPDAKPPIEWERRAESILGLKAQASKPKDGDTGASIADGVIREWLVLGPLPLPEGFKTKNDFKKEIVPGEMTLDASEGDTWKDQTWKKISVDTSCLDFKNLFGPDKVKKDAPTLVAYAQAWIFSDSQQTVIGRSMWAGMDAKIWVNGKTSNHGKVILNQGWNRLTCRAVSKPEEERKNNSWYVRFALFGASGSKYRVKNILWSTRMPGQGYGGPILVGDKLFVTADVANLLCVDKNSGHVLWIRSNTCFDALSEEKRKSDAPEVQAARALHEQLLQMNEKCLGQPDFTWKFFNEKIKIETKIHRAMKQKVYGCEVGSAANTPVSDGKYVYALFANCVLACYDLNGNRKWITHTPRGSGEHGHTSSLVIADDKIVAPLSGSLLAFDKDTGKLLWETSTVYKKNSITYCKFYSTPCVLSQEGKDYLFTPRGQLLRASDGKSLYFGFWKAGGGNCVTPVLINDRIYMNAKSVKFQAIGEDHIEPEIVKLAEIEPKKFPAFYQGSHMASPLIHDGLMYCLNIDGLLSAIDVDKGGIVYQKVLDLDLNAGHHGSAIRAGISSSPALAGKYIYIFGNQGASLILKPGRKYEQVAKNRIEWVAYANHWREHQEITISCPAFEQDRIYVRGESNLYCIGAKQ